MHRFLRGATLALAGAWLVAGAARAQTGAPEPRVHADRIVVDGNTALPDSAVREVTAPYAGHDLSVNDLEELRRRLTLAYVNRGYVSSGAVLPQQDFGRGTIRYQIVEGRLSGIDVTGNVHLSGRWVTDRLASAASTPVNINSVEQRVQLLLQDPAVTRLNVTLVPDVTPGDTRVRVDVKEAERYFLVASVANDEPPVIGSIHGDIAGGVRNLAGVGDVLSAHYGRTLGANFGGASYSVPVTNADTTLTVRYEYNGAGVISSTYAGLGINSVVHTAGVTLSQPVYRSLEQSALVSLTFDHTIDDTYLLGEPFSFTSGFKNGEAQDTVLRTSADFVDRSSEQVIALRATVSKGLPILGATNERKQVNANFLTFLGQAQYVHTVFGRSQFVARTAMQLATRPLFTFEQIALGGPATVRGYIQNALLYDNGVIASAELRVPFAHLKLPYVSTEESDGELQVAPFIDHGHGWNDRLPGIPQAVGGPLGPHGLTSVGAGLRWLVGKNISAQIYYGYALEGLQEAGHDHGRNAVAFNITAQLY